MKDLLTHRLEKLGIKITLLDKDLGYELRCADPIPFDAEYTRDLGYGAVKFLLSPAAKAFGAVVSFDGGKLKPIPFDEMINPATGRMRPRKGDITRETYECARGEVSRGTFIGDLLHNLIFVQAPAWAFTAGYVAFAAVVLATFVLAPPRRRGA